MDQAMVDEITAQTEARMESIIEASEGVKMMQQLQVDPFKDKQLHYSKDRQLVFLLPAYINELCKRAGVQKISLTAMAEQLTEAGYEGVSQGMSVLAGMTKKTRYIKIPVTTIAAVIGDDCATMA
jgi:hypothetical protein